MFDCRLVDLQPSLADEIRRSLGTGGCKGGKGEQGACVLSLDLDFFLEEYQCEACQ